MLYVSAVITNALARFKSKLANKKGAAMIEYAMLAALAVAIGGILTAVLKPRLADVFNWVSSGLGDAAAGFGGGGTGSGG